MESLALIIAGLSYRDEKYRDILHRLTLLAQICSHT